MTISSVIVLVALFSLHDLVLAGTQPPPNASVGVAGLPVGRVIHAASCEQPPAQSVKDRATYTPAELARYGLPPRSPGEPFARWALVVRPVTKRFCDSVVIPGTADWDTQYNTSWSGYYGDQSGGSQNFTEADMDWWAVSASDNASVAESTWAGIGGLNNIYLVQAGSRVTRVYVRGTGWVSECVAWVENYADPTNPGENDMFNIGCGDHMYAKAWAPNNMFVEDLDTGHSAQRQYGPAGSPQTAEAMVERPITQGQQLPLANFGTETLHGVGVTDNGNYYAISCVPGYQMTCIPNTSYAALLLDNSSYTYQLTALGSIQYQANDYPDDQYTITYEHGS